MKRSILLIDLKRAKFQDEVLEAIRSIFIEYLEVEKAFRTTGGYDIVVITDHSGDFESNLFIKELLKATDKIKQIKVLYSQD